MQAAGTLSSRVLQCCSWWDQVLLGLESCGAASVLSRLVAQIGALRSQVCPVRPLLPTRSICYGIAPVSMLLLFLRRVFPSLDRGYHNTYLRRPVNPSAFRDHSFE
jgi:hypothetical protein